MLSMFKRILIIIMSFLLAVLLLGLTGCKEKDGSGYLFKYGLVNDPEILDPQIASDSSSLAVIKNIYAGLFEIASDGGITEGMAESYDVSDDGLTYTFTLKPGYYWISSDTEFKEEVTSNDFIFAFRRIFNPYTRSPYKADFICLKNAEKIINGEKDYTEIGVNAVSKYEIKFELEYSNANFLSLLTSSAAMPCNEKFFNNSKGKYGLETKQTPSNGAFYVKQWEYDPYGKDNYLILRKNKYFAEKNKVYPSSLNFFIEKTMEDVEKDFFSGVTDCAVLNSNSKNIFKKNYARNEFQSISNGLIFNPNSDIFINQTFRKALSLSIDRNYFADKLSEGTYPAYALVPNGVTMLNKSYRELVSENNISVYNPSLAKEQWNKGLKATERFTVDGISILVPKSYSNADSLKFITQCWQNELGFFCGIEVVSDKEYNTRLENGNFDIAFYNLECRYNSPSAILNNFYSKSSINRISYKNGIADSLIEKAAKAKTLNECVDIYAKAEKEIIDDYIYIPVFYETEYLVYLKDMQDIVYDPFTHQIDFKNAKNFD